MRDIHISHPLSMPSVIKIALIAVLLSGASFVHAQMPEWKYFRDREGNSYYLDRMGKIRIAKTPGFRYRPVSALGIDYYLEYGITLIKEHRIIEGLSLLKSILALPADNNRIYTAQAKASEVINSLKKTHGTRYSALNESASLVLIRQNASVDLLNDRMFYFIRLPASMEVVRVKERAGVDYRYTGLLLGIWKPYEGPQTDSKGGYDLLLAVDSEKFSVRLKDLGQAAARWKDILGRDDFRREKLSESESGVIYQLLGTGAQKFSGAEGIFVNGNFSHCVRLISSEANYRADRGIIIKIINSFKTVSQAY
jgi:hypothetical protein